jgi:glyoxylase-like metal-dependent hydrolase (beta-lactamase superfamily II)
VQIEPVDDAGFGFGWRVADELVQRTSHALVDEEGVWLVDPLDWDGLEERLAGKGEVRGVIQLLDRHARDGAALAERFGVPLHRIPRVPPPGSPFHVLGVVDMPTWHEVALWWPEQRTLVCGDALGTARYFLAPGEPLGVHPLLRLKPPGRLRDLPAEHVLCGHGAGRHGAGAAGELARAVATARRRLPAAWLNAVRRRPS